MFIVIIIVVVVAVGGDGRARTCGTSRDCRAAPGRGVGPRGNKVHSGRFSPELRAAPGPRRGPPTPAGEFVCSASEFVCSA
eukprot:894133-Prorocentrum_minimum.AAC.1